MANKLVKYLKAINMAMPFLAAVQTMLPLQEAGLTTEVARRG
jgi:hypothetical protein